MKMRKITSLTAALSFLLMVLTSIILYIVPQGRVAYWADWRLWGLSKTDWGNTTAKHRPLIFEHVKLFSSGGIHMPSDYAVSDIQ